MAESSRSKEIWARRHDRVLIAIACMLCVTPLIKLGEIQLLELIYAADLILVAIWLLLRPSPIRIFRPVARIAMHWVIFSAVCVVFSLLAVRQEFFIADKVSYLKFPVAVTFSRLIELMLDLYAFVYIASRCRDDEFLCRFALRTYLLVGVAGCAWGWAVFIVTLLREGAVSRMSGFNNEGGPFGVYLLTVFATFPALREKRWISRRGLLVIVPLMLASLIASQSKAALIEIVAALILIGTFKMNPWRTVLLGTVTASCIFVVFQTLGLSNAALAYVNAREKFPAVSQLRPDDYNLVVGRVPGVFIAPKMIAAHPLTGVGLGNYPIVRDDPKYRRGAVIVGVAVDSPSLGIVDYLVDLGIPLTAYMLWIQFSPIRFVAKRGGSLGVVALLLTMPISICFGAHLNLTFFWITAAFGVALFYLDRRSDGTRWSESKQAHLPTTHKRLPGSLLQELSVQG